MCHLNLRNFFGVILAAVILFLALWIFLSPSSPQLSDGVAAASMAVQANRLTGDFYCVVR